MQETLQFARLVELDNSTHGPIIAPSDEFLANPNGRYRSTTKQISHFGADSLAVRIDIQLNDCIFGPDAIQDLFGLDAIGAPAYAQKRRMGEILVGVRTQSDAADFWLT